MKTIYALVLQEDEAWPTLLTFRISAEDLKKLMAICRKVPKYKQDAPWHVICEIETMSPFQMDKAIYLRSSPGVNNRVHQDSRIGVSHHSVELRVYEDWVNETHVHAPYTQLMALQDDDHIMIEDDSIQGMYPEEEILGRLQLLEDPNPARCYQQLIQN